MLHGIPFRNQGEGHVVAADAVQIHHVEGEVFAQGESKIRLRQEPSLYQDLAQQRASLLLLGKRPLDLLLARDPAGNQKPAERVRLSRGHHRGQLFGRHVTLTTTVLSQRGRDQIPSRAVGLPS